MSWREKVQESLEFAVKRMHDFTALSFNTCVQRTVVNNNYTFSCVIKCSVESRVKWEGSGKCPGHY